jgi:hypothetical protein
MGAALGFNRQQPLALEAAAQAADPQAAHNIPKRKQAQLTQVFRGKSGSRHEVALRKLTYRLGTSGFHAAVSADGHVLRERAQPTPPGVPSQPCCEGQHPEALLQQQQCRFNAQAAALS